MGDFFVLTAALLLLIFVLDTLAKLKVSSKDKNENILKLYLGFLILIAISVIPYKLWKLTGSHHSPDGMIVTAGAALAMIVFVIRFYSRRVKNHA